MKFFPQVLLPTAGCATIAAAGFWFLPTRHYQPTSQLRMFVSSSDRFPAPAPATDLPRALSDDHLTPDKLRGAFDDPSPRNRLAKRAEASKDEPVAITLPPGTDARILRILDRNPELRVPASLAAPNPKVPLTFPQRVRKQEIARDFINSVATRNWSNRDPATLSVEWNTAQRMADQQLSAALGDSTTHHLGASVNPEVEERAAAARLEAQRALIQERNERSATDPSLDSETSAAARLTKEELQANREAYQWYLVSGLYGGYRTN